MDMKVHCPGCSKPLRVPKTSSGRKARCPNCRKVFIVPAPDELVDETISTWIEEDVEKLEVEHEKQWESIGSLKSYQRPQQVGSPAVLPDRLKHAGGGRHDKGHAATAEHEAERSTVTAIDDLAPLSTGNGGTIEVTAAPAAPVRPAAPAPMRAASAESIDAPYPTNLLVDPGQPHLVVVRCDQGGVCIAFDSTCLEHIGFRMSMPVRCAFTGDMERRRLFARPLAFIDRSAARIRSTQEIDSKYTTTLLSGQSTRELLDVIGNIDALPKPFSLCLPYYGSQEYSHSSLKCWTETRPEGGVTCFVIIPNGPVALHWLLHVNGTCGIEFAKLEQDIALLDNEAWRLLGDECRKRLAVWCPFEAGERFHLYLCDGDFGTRDKGLAGLVLTDRRLIYCKYHHRGAVDLAQPGTLLIRDETDFAQLALENADGKTKLAKLHLHDVPVLLEALNSRPHIRIDRKPAATATT